MEKKEYGLKGPGSLHEDPSKMDNYEMDQHRCALERRINDKEKEILERHGIEDPKGVCQKIFNEKSTGNITDGRVLEGLMDYVTLQITLYEAETVHDAYSGRQRDLKYFWETVKTTINEKLHQDSRKF